MVRPLKDEKELTTGIRVSRHAQEQLDREVINRWQESVAGDRLAGKPIPYEMPAYLLAKERRLFLERLIEDACGPKAGAPVRINVTVMGSAKDYREAADWVEAQEERLLAEAPAGIRRAYELRTAMRAAVMGEHDEHDTDA